MKLFERLFIGLSLLISACSGSNGQSNSYLKLGGTGSTGNLSYTMTRLEYVDGLSSDPNKRSFELEFILHSNSTSYISLDGFYTISFDGSSNESMVIYGTIPSSIAPKSDVPVVLENECFPDWKTMTIRLRNGPTPTFAFSIRHSDYPNESNFYSKYYPTLNIGDSHTYLDNGISVKLNSFVLSTAGSSGSGQNNMSLQFTLYNNTDTDLSFPSVISSISVVFDGGMTSGGINFSTPNNPQSVSAHSHADFYLAISATNTWQIMRVTHKISDTMRYSFICYHSDFPDII